MSALPEEEKNKIRADMEYRDLVSKELAPTKGGLSAFLSHPAFITVLGGILISLVGIFFQNVYAFQQQDIARQHALRDKKYELLTAFTSQFDRDMTLLYNMRLERLWLNRQYAKHRTAQQNKEIEIIRTRYFAYADQYSRTHQAVALLLQIEVLFDDPQIVLVAQRLLALVKLLEESDFDSNQEILQLDRAIEIDMAKLAAVMGQEIRTVPAREWRILQF